MDKQIKIQLNSNQNVNSVNEDMYEKISLNNTLSEINEYDIRNSISATDIFDIERSSNNIYRIYGKIEYLSLLNELRNDYSKFEDFFLPQINNSKNILNSFDFYLVKAATGHTKITGSGSTWIRYFKVISTPKDFELFPVGFSNNVYGEQGYSFNFNVDFDISNYFDEFGFPATELFLYAQYKKASSPVEVLYGTMWTNEGISGKTAINTTTLNIGDYVKTSTVDQKIGDLVEYIKNDFTQIELFPQIFYITTPYEEDSDPSHNNYLQWCYNPFIPIRLRYLTDSVYTVNMGSTSYDQVSSIPSYATKIDNSGNFVWRNIMPEGYIDPLTGIGTDYPFINGKRYLFTSIILDIVPNLEDLTTASAFSDVWFTRNATNSSITPTGNINNIGQPC